MERKTKKPSPEGWDGLSPGITLCLFAIGDGTFIPYSRLQVKAPTFNQSWWQASELASCGLGPNNVTLTQG